ncbi:MAG: Bacterial alpha-L-rhamnosidase, partial [Candidatus Lokiarchaeota archaeon]|nr:Bacterial alpha-L-rhamnosidase [Candidatus Lokiarchaeota archaeon]
SLTISSNKQTRGYICNAWKHTLLRNWVGLPFLEIFNRNKWPDEWLDIDYNDSGSEWNHTKVINERNEQPLLVKCDIPRLSEEKMVAETMVQAGKVEPYFNEEDFKDAEEEGEEPIDFFMQLAFSNFKTNNTELTEKWNQHHSIEFDVGDSPMGCVFDMGKEVSGFIFFDIECDREDIIVDLGWGEKLDDNMEYPRPKYQPYHQKYGGRYIARKGTNKHELFHWYGLRYIQMNISAPESQKRKHLEKTSIKINNVGINLYLYPLKEVGMFQSDQTSINKLYNACKWTLRNCMHDGYEDCPSREQRQWVGDAYVEVLVNLMTYGDIPLVHKLLRQVAQSQRGDGLCQMATPGDHEIHGTLIPDYTLYWISTLYEYYWYTGDNELVEELMPYVIIAIRWFIQYIDDNSGLLNEIPHWIFIDWSDNDKWGINGVLNAQLYRVLCEVIELSKGTTFEDAVSRFKPIKSRIKANFAKYLWNSQRNAYIDAVRIDTHGEIVDKSKKISFHTNALAILSDLCSAQQIKLIIENVFDKPYSEIYVKNREPIFTNQCPAPLDPEKHVIMAEPFFMHHVNQMFAKVNRYDLIERYIQDGWVKMIEMGATSIWETWSDAGSLCHAWAATPAFDLIKHCAGFKIMKPGATHIKIEPHLMGLSYVKVIIPTIKGSVKINWKFNAQEKKFILEYSVPESVKVEIIPPKINKRSPQDKICLESDENMDNRVEFHY